MIVSVCKMRDGWSGSFSYPFREGYRTTYSVLVNQEDEGPASIYTLAEIDAANDAPGRLPLLGHIYNPDRLDIASQGEGSTFAICHGLEITPFLEGAASDGSFVWNGQTVWEWRYQVQWDPPDTRLPGGQGVKNPILRPIVEWFEFEEEEVPLTHHPDTGLLITNTAGEPLLDPPITTTRIIPIRVVHKNYASLDEVEDLINAYVPSVNSGPWRHYKAKQCLMRAPTVGRPRIENGVYFVPVEWRIAIKEAYPVGSEVWQPFEATNAGFQWCNPNKLDNGQKVPGGMVEAILLEQVSSKPMEPDKKLGVYTKPTGPMKLWKFVDANGNPVIDESIADYRPYVLDQSFPEFKIPINKWRETDFNALLAPGLQPSDFLGQFQF